MKNFTKSILITLFLLILNSVSYSAIYKVAKDKELWGANFDKIQDAVDACNSGEDIIIIMDDEVYKERVVIDSAKGIHITSQAYMNDPGAIQFKNYPTILYKDTEHFAPYTAAEVKTNSDEFQRNGALCIQYSSNITIEGITINGEKEYPYKSKEGVWGGGMYPLVHGNSGIAIFLSKLVTIRSCEILNTYTGIYVVDRNPAGEYAVANVDDNDVAEQIAMSKLGQIGNHLFELNRIHDNSFAVGTEIMWGLGSTFRHNLIYNNFGKVKNDNYYGGFIRIKDHVVQPWLIYNNTLYNNETVIHHAYWRAGSNFLFASNIVGEGSHVFGNGIDANQSAQMEQIGNVSSQYNNIWQPRTKPKAESFYVQGVGNSDLFTPPIWIFYNINLITSNMDASNFNWDDVQAEYDGKMYTVTPEKPTFDSRITSVKGSNSTIDLSGKNNTMVVTNYSEGVYRKMFKSVDESDPDFLIPNYDDNWVLNGVRDNGYKNLGVVDADGTNGDVGALCVLQTTGKNDWTGQTKSAQLKVVDGSVVIVGNDKIAKIIFPIKVIGGKENDFDPTTLKFEKIDFYDNMPSLGPGVDDQSPKGLMPDPINVLSGVKSGIPLIGGNYLQIKLDKMPTLNSYGMFQVVVSGINKYKEKVFSNIGVFPFRNFTYDYSDGIKGAPKQDIVNLNTQFEDENGNDITEIGVGEKVWLHVVSETSFSMSKDNFNISTMSGTNITAGSKDVVVTKWSDADGNSKSYTDDERMPIRFNKTGYQIINASGYNDSKQTGIGVSNVIKVTSAVPHHVKFYDPPSSKGNENLVTIIPQNSSYPAKINVYDVYGNLAVNIDPNDTWKIEFKSADEKIITFSSSDVLLEKNGQVEVNITAVGTTGDETKIQARLLGSSTTEWQDFANIKIGQPLTMLYAKEATNSTYVGSSVKVDLMISEDGLNVDTDYVAQNSPIMASIDNLGNDNLKFYSDETMSQEIKSGTPFELVDGKTSIYFTSNKEGDYKFSVKPVTTMRVNNINTVKFSIPPVQRIFLTWKNDSLSLTKNPIAVSYKDGSITVYAWGEDTQGNIFPIAVNWSGKGVFSDSKGELTLSHTVILTDAMKNQTGTIIASYKKSEDKTFTVPTPLITIIGDIDRIFILKKSDYDSNTTINDLPNLELKATDTIKWTLGENINLVSIGVDDTLKTMNNVSMEWSLIGSNPSFNFLTDSSNAPSYDKTLDINNRDAVGNVSLSIKSLSRNNTPLVKSSNIKVIDPVDNISVTLLYNLKSDQIVVTSANANDTINADLYLTSQLGKKYLMSVSGWQKDTSSLVMCAVDWKIESMILKNNAIYNNYTVSSDTSRASGTDKVDILKYTVSRNGISYSFFVKLVDAIEFGIMPNPTSSSMFNKNKKPIIRAVVEGKIESMNATIYDGNGNFIYKLTEKDFKIKGKDEPFTDTTSENSNKISINNYESTAWNGKTQDGKNINSGVYIINYRIKTDKKYYNDIKPVPFYYIRDTK